MTVTRACIRAMLALLLGSGFAAGASPVSAADESSVPYRGVDLSFLPEIEAYGTAFADSGRCLPALDIFKNHGANLVRVRLWHSPASGHSDRAEVLSFARRIKRAGLDMLLDIHYSDTWADPGRQTIPAAWINATPAQLCDSVYTYTRSILRALGDQNTLPAIVQIGNEINSGMLWDVGRVGGRFEGNWPGLARLIRSAIDGIRSVDAEERVRIMLHVAGTAGARSFFDRARSFDLKYDVIGISYYPWWHGGSLDSLAMALDALAGTYQKDVMVVETAYPWTLRWNDMTHNIVGMPGQLIAAYPATPDGQRRFLFDLRMRIAGLDGGRGIGFCYWAPEWIAFKGPEAVDGSPWENCALFDFDHEALSAIEAFRK
jgi:arabinogalactan endo-1,4-beta-galactosidase